MHRSSQCDDDFMFAVAVAVVQLAGVLRAATNLLKDIHAFNNFKGQIRDLVGKLDAFQKDQFKVCVRIIYVDICCLRG